MIKFILCFLSGMALILLVLLPILLKKVHSDKETEENNKKLREEWNNLKEYKNLALAAAAQAESGYKEVKARQEEASQNLELLEKQAKESANKFYNQNMELAQTNLDIALEKISEEFEQNTEEYKKEYLKTLEDAAADIAEFLSSNREEMDKVSEQLQTLKSNVSAAIAVSKHREEEKLEQNKYKIILTNEDLNEINRLREVAPYLRNARPVYKIIWESYYRNPTTDLINRVVGNGTKTGIYRLTNQLNDMSYIGQAVNIGDRMKQHIKCGLGIDTPNNKLYQAMKQDGVENFKFEIVEECNRENLNKQEKYWISFYEAETWGYNMTSGGAKNK